MNRYVATLSHRPVAGAVFSAIGIPTLFVIAVIPTHLFDSGNVGVFSFWFGLIVSFAAWAYTLLSISLEASKFRQQDARRSWIAKRFEKVPLIGSCLAFLGIAYVANFAIGYLINLFESRITANIMAFIWVAVVFVTMLFGLLIFVNYRVLVRIKRQA